MSVPPRGVHRRRATITALPLYYSGHLLKKNTKEKDFKKFFAELRGATLFLYKDETQDVYTEKLELEEVKSMEVNSPYLQTTPTIFTFSLPTEEVQFKIVNPDTGEEWRGYILTVVKKEIPSKLLLLPGQMLLLQEALAQERRRNVPARCPPLPPRPSFLLSASTAPQADAEKPDHSSPDKPVCFYDVTREEAERMLDANPEYGDIIIRPSKLGNNYAVTLRQLMPSGPVMKNFRVTSATSGFVIELDTPVTVPSLKDVLKYILEKTQQHFSPYTVPQPYDTRLEVSHAPTCTSITSPTRKAVPWAHVAPMLHSHTHEELVLPPTKPADCEYVYCSTSGNIYTVMREDSPEIANTVKSYAKDYEKSSSVARAPEKVSYS